MSPNPPPLPLEALLADAGWVRRLAARLVADPGTAEDLAQETLVAAWRRPPAAGTPARPWLARVLRNFTRLDARARGARNLRERAAARPVAADDDLVARAELAQRLARLVLELEEPYRSTVLRRFFDGWSAAEIARREGTNPSTVRTRLERGLGQLRARLERERGREWMAALAPLWKIGGGLAMGTGMKIGIAVCGAALCGWLLWPRAQPAAPAAALEPLAPSAPVAQAPEPDTATAVADTRKSVETLPAAPAPAKSVQPAAVPEGAIEGLVLFRTLPSIDPIAGAQITLYEDYDPRQLRSALELPELARATSAADGSFRLEHLAPRKYTLVARTRSATREMQVVLTKGQPGAQVEFVFGTARIRGTLRGEGGAPLEGLVVRLDSGLQGRPESAPSMRGAVLSDAAGAFRFDELPQGAYFFNVGGGPGFWRQDWPGRMDNIVLVANDDLVLEIGPPSGPVHWQGALRTATGEPVTGGGTLYLERDELSPGGSKVHSYLEVRLQQDGKFDFAIEPARWTVALSLASHPEKRLSCGEIDVPSAGLQQDLVVPGVRLFGTVTDAATQMPLAGYQGILRIAVHRPGENYSAAMHEATLGEAAGYVIDMLEDGDWEVVTYPIDLSAPGKSLAFRIGKGEGQHRLDLEVRKP